MPDTDIKAYYARRAPEYDSIYEKPERREDLDRLGACLVDLFRGQDVLELACGTGYWTGVIAPSARSILATDVNEETLRIARTRTVTPGKVTFMEADAFTLEGVTGRFTAGFAGFWWSHLLRKQMPGFLEGFHSKLAPGARVAFADNRYVEGSSSPISRADAEGNRYQIRRLSDGSEYEVIKNFPEEADLRGALDGRADDIRYTAWTYYWTVSYRI